MNKAKNEFLKWLKKNNADNIDIYAPEDSEWNYYVMVSGFISSHLYTSTFMVLKEKQSVDYRYEGSIHRDLSVDEFLELIR